MLHDLILALVSIAVALIGAWVPIRYKTGKDIERAKTEMYAVQNASHMEERRLEIEQRIAQSLRMSQIVREQDKKLEDFAKRIFDMQKKLNECDEERGEYKHTMLRQAAELKLATSQNAMLKEVIDRQNRIIDIFGSRFASGEST